MEGKKNEMRDWNSEYFQSYVQKYKRLLKTLPVKVAAIEKFNPEVIVPFVETALIEANITEENINTCSQGSCETQLKEAELNLITPTEFLKVR